jgi:hypothetical protein
MICTCCMSVELWVFKVIIIYAFFIKFIDNEKNERKVMGQMMMCTLCISNYYFVIFLEIIDNKNREK